MLDQQNPVCAECGASFPSPPPSGGASGYAVRSDGARICYDCSAKAEQEAMIRDGKATLYLVRDPAGFHAVTDWPGKLRFPATVSRMRHPFVHEAWLARFTGPDGKPWSGRNIGDNQLVHCKRLKA